MSGGITLKTAVDHFEEEVVIDMHRVIRHGRFTQWVKVATPHHARCPTAIFRIINWKNPNASQHLLKINYTSGKLPIPYSCDNLPR
jgi:hypothetical protein